MDSGPHSGVPDFIGHYRIIRVIGVGGMGTVYEAEQQNPRRSVALKVIRSDLRFARALEYFHREAEALARLRHPAIAQIYESGRTDDGRDYYAMELLSGVPLGAYLEQNRIDSTTTRRKVRELLMLFRSICEGVSYAHQRGVIHRDLKPDNIFIDAPATDTRQSQTGGQSYAKILDFGIAKITDAAASHETRVGEIVGTYAYMSPEQASGDTDHVDARADVYSLGVILYELLTGGPPFPANGHPMALVHRVLNAEPVAPSSVWRAHGLRLGGDLETIVLKALAKTPDQRYQSAWALAEDIDRYVNDQPILARGPSTAYYVRKLVSRHRVPFAAAAAILVALTASLAATTISRNRALDAEATARSEADRAGVINDFLLRMLSSADPGQDGRDVRVVDVLADASVEADVAFRDRPDVDIVVRTVIGRTYMGLGLYNDAERYLESAIDLGRATDNPWIAVTLDAMGTLHMTRGEYDQALPLLEESLAIRRSVMGERSEAVAMSLNNIGTFHVRRGNFQEAERYLAQALEIRREVLPPTHEDLSRTLLNISVAYLKLGRLAEAEAGFREGIAIRRRDTGGEHLDIAIALNNLAIQLSNAGRMEEAEPLFVESMAMHERVLGPDHPMYANSLNNVGLFLYRQHRYEQSESMLREALSIQQRTIEAPHPEIASAMNNLGLLLRDTERLVEGEDMLRAALAMNEQVRPGHQAVAETRTNLAALLVAAGRYAAAEQMYRVARAETVDLVGETDERVLSIDSLLGECLLRMGQTAEARELLLGAYQGLSADLPTENRRVQSTLLRLVMLYEALDEPMTAAEYRALILPGTER